MLDALLAPVAPAEFLARCWDLAPTHLTPQARSGRPPPLSRADLDALMARQSRLEGPSTIEDLLAAGRGLEIVQPEAALPELAAWVAPLAQAFFGEARLAAILTPPQAGASAYRWDSDSAFLFQCEGESVWRLWAPELTRPWPEERFEGGAPGDDAPIGDVRLEPGALLYLPRGFRSAAVTPDAPSLHLRVGILPLTWRDVLHEAALRLEAPAADELAPAELPLPDDAIDLFEELLEDFVETASAAPALAAAMPRHGPTGRSPSGLPVTWRQVLLEAIARFDDPLARHAPRRDPLDEMDQLRFVEIKERLLEMADAEEALASLLGIDP